MGSPNAYEKTGESQVNVRHHYLWRYEEIAFFHRATASVGSTCMAILITKKLRRLAPQEVANPCLIDRFNSPGANLSNGEIDPRQANLHTAKILLRIKVSGYSSIVSG